jgi:CubicO group peptidase (beta-lactamase class C family)
VPHVYTLTVGAGHFVRGQADQRSVDVVVRVLDPSGGVLATFDDPARGPEAFRFTTAVAGEHRIEVAGFENDSGTYILRLDRAEPFATDPVARVDQIMSDYDPTSPGGVVAVVRNGDVEFVRGYGLANLEYGIPNGPETVFHMASVSKQFTAFAILLLAEQGLLSLDDDIRKHLPEMADFGTPITIRHLVHHTSGLRDQWTLWTMAGGRMDDVITHGDLLSLIFRQKELNFSPGSEHLYSNTGYSLMAEIVERVTGEPFGAWMQRTVFDPLGMKSTQIYDDHERIVPNRAYSYHRDRDGRWAKSVLSYANRGATSLFTTARDLARWLENYRTAQVGGASVMADMKQRGVLTNGDTIPYAFAIVHGRYRGLDMLQHGGADAGYRTALVYFPAVDAGVIVLSNDAGFNSGAVARDVAAAFFADRMTAAQPNPTPPSQPARPEPWKPTAEQLQVYAGVYYSPELETRYTVRVSDGALVAVHRRHGDLALRPVEQDRFNVPTSWFFTNVRFERAADGSITGMRVSSGRVRNLLFERLRT